MKKTIWLILFMALLIPSVFAAPTDEDVAATFSGVFGVYGAMFFSAMMGQEIPGAEMDMDMETGSSSLTFNNLETRALFAAIGESVDGSGDMPVIPFTHISGIFAADADGNLNMDVTLKGGPVKRLELQTAGDDILSLKADGRSYEHLESFLMNLED